MIYIDGGKRDDTQKIGGAEKEKGESTLQSTEVSAYQGVGVGIEQKRSPVK